MSVFFFGLEKSFLFRKFGIKSIVIKKVAIKSIVQFYKDIDGTLESYDVQDIPEDDDRVICEKIMFSSFC